ncbi:MAG TPA: 2,3-bisphosphoglycerate-independent phosphoglycerate mutase [Deltaproteobacteria bacterium]|nr:2,3-bisphosphoglycerate-independent phosphoglycerate mutase [Deltaproteobacteria bacterium]
MSKRNTADRPMVVGREGQHRFQTGMITATLLAHGVSMGEAFTLSKQLRRQVEGLETITTAELKDAICRLLVRHGYDPTPATAMETDLGLLRDLSAVGVPHARIAELARKITANELSIHKIPKPYRRRLRLVQWMRSADRPVIIFLAGATGTGKSSLAMELAFRLGMRIAVGTDMIREAMRTVLSAEVVPGLHDHSFRGMLQGGGVLSDPRERVLAGYRQQAAQVSVGVRSVVRRALRESAHMIIEGTHLQPPFEQYLDPEAELYHAGLMLAVPSSKVHRRRFPMRAAAQRMRDPAAYLDAFESVRWIHDDLLSQAEDADVVVLPTEDLQASIGAALDALASILPMSRSRGASRSATASDPVPDVRTLLLILDGMSDEPSGALGGLTPLTAAPTPTLDRLAGIGGQGQILTAVDGNLPHTDEGLWALLSPERLGQRLGRGLFEAAGRGISLPRDGILFRGNLATCAPSSLAILDRRAGRINAGVRDLIAGLEDVPLSGGIRGRLYEGHEHRVVVVLVGPGLSAAVADTDPGSAAPTQQVIRPRPLDDTPEAARTAAALRELLKLVNDHLTDHPLNTERVAAGLPPANTVLTRGAASTAEIPRPVHRPEHAAMVASCPTALGVARLLGMHAVTSANMTGNLDTDIHGKLATAGQMLQSHPLVCVHLKGTDVAAHDRRPIAKRDFIARFDQALGELLESNPELQADLRVVITADHGTSSSTGDHLVDPVPLLLAHLHEGVDAGTATFDEISAEQGALGLLHPGELAALLWHQP